MTEKLILFKLDTIAQAQQETSEEITGIKDKLQQLATQKIEIKNMMKQTERLFNKCDHIEDSVVEVVKFQQSCPRESVKGQFNRIWLFLFTIIAVSATGLTMIINAYHGSGN